jgi:hypothetical protein
MKLNKPSTKTKLAISSLAVLALTAGMSVAQAQILTFEGLQNLEPIDNYYNGGFGGDGSGPGPNYGITFGADSLAIIADSAGGSGNFSGNPSGDTIAFFLSGPGDIMDKASGFNTGFSFYYSSQSQANTGSEGAVTVWSGPDGTGSELADIPLADTPNTAGYNVWDPIGVAFSGTAESAVFTGGANFIGFDDITLGSSVPDTQTVPDGGGLTLDLIAGLALAAAGFVAKKNAVSC